MKAGGKSCVDPGFYSANDPTSSPEEARIVLLGKLNEQELTKDVEDESETT
jgi:hypothetical protein